MPCWDIGLAPYWSGLQLNCMLNRVAKLGDYEKVMNKLIDFEKGLGKLVDY